MWEISQKSIQRYFDLLQYTGYVPYNEVYDLLSLVVIEEFINESFQDLISEDDLKLLQTYLSTLFNNTCLIGCFPNTLNMEYWSNEGTGTSVATKISELSTKVASFSNSLEKNTQDIAKQDTRISTAETLIKTNTANIKTTNTTVSNISTQVDANNLALKQLSATKKILPIGGITEIQPSVASTSAIGGGKEYGGTVSVYASEKDISTLRSPKFYITYQGKNYSSWAGFTDIVDSSVYNEFDVGTIYVQNLPTSSISEGPIYYYRKGTNLVQLPSNDDLKATNETLTTLKSYVVVV